MKKIKKYLLFPIIVVLLGTSIIYAANNYFRNWINSDTVNWLNNDTWTLSWRLDLEDSLSALYATWRRWLITGTVESTLFWLFDIDNTPWLVLSESSKIIPATCWTSFEVYDINWTVTSPFWWLLTVQTWSYFCSDQYIEMEFYSDSLWSKDIWWTWSLWWPTNVFIKQKVWISGISSIKWDLDNILAQTDNINELDYWVSSKAVVKQNINRRVFDILKTYKNQLITNIYSINNINFFNNTTTLDEYHLYDYAWQNESLTFGWWSYKNDWKTLNIWNDWNGKIAITWKNTLIVNSWNVYINTNLYNYDTESVLVIVARKWINWEGWNVYINNDVTNIDAIIMAEGSILSRKGTKILQIPDDKDDLRKQLLIYWSVFSANSIWTDIVPYWADYYGDYPSNIMSWNIYDLANLRVFNLNYWTVWSACPNDLDLVPIDWITWTWVLEYAWAWRKQCYNSDSIDAWLRGSDRRNPIIIDYNPKVTSIDMYILKK